MKEVGTADPACASCKMIWPADYHLHPRLCRRATGQPSELAAQAARLGFPEIGFSDHNPMPGDDFDDWRIGHPPPELIASCRAVWTVVTLNLSFLAIAVNSLPWLIISTMEFSRGARRVQRLSQSSLRAALIDGSFWPEASTEM